MRRNVLINHEMLNSTAFRKLFRGKATAAYVLLIFMQKRKWTKTGRRKKIEYVDEPIAFSFWEAKNRGISQSSFFRAVNALIALGFLDPEHRGGIYGKDVSTFRLSERWRKYGTPDFKVVKRDRRMYHGQDIRSNIRRKKDRPHSKVLKSSLETSIQADTRDGIIFSVSPMKPLSVFLKNRGKDNGNRWGRDLLAIKDRLNHTLTDETPMHPKKARRGFIGESSHTLTDESVK